ncbi:MAG TPA: ABC transporter ATP-binding protein [Candidatus Limnocylindrales bacterium]
MVTQASPLAERGRDSTLEPVIEARRLTKRYGARVAVDDLSFEVRPGEVFGLLGPNGAGKTTTVLMLLGLTEPTSGEARVVGVDPMRDPLEVKRHVGYMPDTVGFYDGLSARENLAYTARLNRIPRAVAAERISDLLAQVGLAEVAAQKVDTFSRGMRQRLGVADALLKDPSVLILDEPTASLDPEGVVELLALIERIALERRIAVLLSSHLLDQVQAICQRVGIFYRGRLIAEGSVHDLASEGSRTQDVVEVGAQASDGRPAGVDLVTAAFRGTPGVASVAPDPDAPGRVLVTGAPGIAGTLASALAATGLRPVHLRTHEERLDAIYTRLVHAAAEAPVAAPEGRTVRLAPAPRRSIRRAPGRAGHPRPERRDRDGGAQDRGDHDRGDGNDHHDDDAGRPR